MSEKLKHVLLMRPAGRNQGLIEALSGRGVGAIELPMISIELAEDDEKIKDIKQQLTGVIAPELDTAYKLDTTFDYALFVSSNAVDATAAYCSKYQVAWPAGLPCYGMGKKTLASIEEQGWLAIKPEGVEGDSDSITSEKMLEQPWAVQVEGKRIAIIKGEKGRGLMADIFRQRGALVEAIAMYRREPVSYEQADWEPKLTTITEAPESSAIIFTSGEILKNFCEMIQNSAVQQRLPQLRCLVPSLRVALEAKEQGFEKVVVAKGASDNAFLPHLLALSS